MPKKLPAVSTVARALIGGIKGAYEFLGLSALHSGLWFVLHIPFWIVLYTAWNNLSAGLPGASQAPQIPWLFIVLALVVTGAFLAAPANAALLYVVRLAREDEARIRDFFLGFKKYYWRTVAVYTSFIAVIAVLLVDITAAARLRNWLTTISLILAGYVLIFVLFMSNYLFPLLVLQDNGFKKVWKKAALLTLDNGFLSLFLTVLTLALYALSAVFSILLVLFYPALTGHSHYLLFEALLGKYEDEGSGAGGVGQETEPTAEGGGN